MMRHGISASGYGALMSINGVMIVVLQPAITRLIARRKRTSVLAMSALLFGVGFGLHAICTTIQADPVARIDIILGCLTQPAE